MNIAVINLKDIFKYLVIVIIIICLIIVLISFLKSEGVRKQEDIIKESINVKAKQITRYAFTNCLDLSLPLISYTKKDEEKELLSPVSTILSLELGMIEKAVSEETEIVKDKSEPTTIEDVRKVENEDVEMPKEVVTERVAENNIPEKSTNSYKTVQINNSSIYEITEEMLIPDVEIINKKDIFIYHTHTCESYTPSEQYSYEMTGNFRTTDLNYTVARGGLELKKYLETKGFNVVQDMTYHDYPTYSGSYTRALETAENNLYGKDIQLVFDLHRDALGNNSQYAPTVKINDMYAAQLMFVIRNGWGWARSPKLETKPKSSCENTRESK